MTTYGRGAESPRLNLEFHPNLKNVFKYNIFDSLRLTPYQLRSHNYCVLISILVQLEYIKYGSFIFTTMRKIRNLLQHLIYSGNTDFTNGVTIDQFNTIENDKDLFNKLKQFYPTVLANYESFSLNLYTCQHSDKIKAFHLIPIRLGKFFSSSHLNIDLLKDSRDIRPPGKKKTSKNNKSTNNSFKHVLVILNFIRLHQNFRYYNYSLATLRDTEICRR